jgi:hypothetical protein
VQPVKFNTRAASQIQHSRNQLNSMLSQLNELNFAQPLSSVLARPVRFNICAVNEIQYSNSQSNSILVKTTEFNARAANHIQYSPNQFGILATNEIPGHLGLKIL